VYKDPLDASRGIVTGLIAASVVWSLVIVAACMWIWRC
jgi:hypothetical protein